MFFCIFHGDLFANTPPPHTKTHRNNTNNTSTRLPKAFSKTKQKTGTSPPSALLPNQGHAAHRRSLRRRRGDAPGAAGARRAARGPDRQRRDGAAGGGGRRVEVHWWWGNGNTGLIKGRLPRSSKLIVFFNPLSTLMRI